NSASSRAPQVAACTVPDCTWDHRTSAGASASSPKVCCGTASQYCGGVSPLLRCGRQHTRQHLLVVRTLLVWDRRGQKTSQFVLCWLLLVEAPEQFKDAHGRALVGNQRDRVVHRDVARFDHAAVDAGLLRVAELLHELWIFHPRRDRDTGDAWGRYLQQYRPHTQSVPNSQRRA